MRRVKSTTLVSGVYHGKYPSPSWHLGRRLLLFFPVLALFDENARTTHFVVHANSLPFFFFFF
jgi:hypothetical protein